MAGLALTLDLLLRKNANKAFHKHDIFSATQAAKSAAATAAAALAPIANFAFSDHHQSSHVAYCDAATGVARNRYSIPGEVFGKSPSAKVYKIEMKPLLSSFHWKNLRLTTLRAFLLHFSPLLLEATREDEDADEERERLRKADFVDALKKAAKQITLETTVGTTRRVLERIAVQFVSGRMAWKLLKDTSRSAARKALRGMSGFGYIFAVSRTSFRGHFLEILASWVVQFGRDLYRFFSTTNIDDENVINRLRRLGKKVFVTTIRCGASLLLGSVGASIGAYVIWPATGQWIGFTVGALGGPLVLSICLEKLFHLQL